MGAAGGLGASTLAGALAAEAARLDECALVDLDPLGGGIDLALGVEDEAGLRWPDLASVDGMVEGDRLLARLPRSAGAAVLSHGRDGDALSSGEDGQCAAADVVGGLARDCGLVVLDCPRSPEGLRLALDLADGVILLGGSDVRGLAALSRLAGELRGLPVVAVLRGDRGAVEVAELVEEVLDVPALRLGHDAKVLRAQRLGCAPATSGPVVTVARRLLVEVESWVARSRASGTAADGVDAGWAA